MGGEPRHRRLIDHFEAANRGAWQKTGPRSFDLTGLQYDFDGAGNLVVIQRIRARAQVPLDDPDTMAAAFLVDVFFPGMDPLHDEPVQTIGPIPTDFMQRVKVMPLPELD